MYACKTSEAGKAADLATIMQNRKIVILVYNCVASVSFYREDGLHVNGDLALTN